ncbi:hypothetical protein CLP_0822 [Clostridium butyricum E4 str. BoNT E BL5262]|uniref:Uncharacterized protein n=1 Tax=Clostridium butyricum E4 str. BoNT E BL5262 TaxID=632245 RepID=C4ICE5_CLOBU|nr:hypothetical protein CLP_0822 [Clostridium butyricum E4 str. BoNT E BL5262]
MTYWSYISFWSRKSVVLGILYRVWEIIEYKVCVDNDNLYKWRERKICKWRKNKYQM